MTRWLRQRLWCVGCAEARRQPFRVCPAASGRQSCLCTCDGCSHLLWQDYEADKIWDSAALASELKHHGGKLFKPPEDRADLGRAFERFALMAALNGSCFLYDALAPFQMVLTKDKGPGDPSRYHVADGRGTNGVAAEHDMEEYEGEGEPGCCVAKLLDQWTCISGSADLFMSRSAEGQLSD